MVVRTFPWTQVYTTAAYLRLLNTYSNHRNLDEPVRARLFREIGDLIDRPCGGAITKSYRAVLHLAHK